MLRADPRSTARWSRYESTCRASTSGSRLAFSECARTIGHGASAGRSGFPVARAVAIASMPDTAVALTMSPRSGHVDGVGERNPRNLEIGFFVFGIVALHLVQPLGEEDANRLVVNPGERATSTSTDHRSAPSPVLFANSRAAASTGLSPGASSRPAGISHNRCPSG